MDDIEDDSTNVAGLSGVIDNPRVAEIENDILDGIGEDNNEEDIDLMFSKSMENIENLGNDDIQPITDNNNVEPEVENSVSNFGMTELPQEIMNEENTKNISYNPYGSSFRNEYNEDQKRHELINRVINDSDDTSFSIEKEKEEDDKTILLEQIDMLIQNLSDEGIDVSRIPKVDTDSKLEQIVNVHKILRLKNDRNRYCGFAEECILAGAYGLEWLCNGERNILGMQPDLRGWNATVNMKLRSMRYDTSTMVHNIMKGYNLSHGKRILLELLPSMFLYSKMKKGQSKDNLISSNEMDSAMKKIRDIEEIEG